MMMIAAVVRRGNRSVADSCLSQLHGFRWVGNKVIRKLLSSNTMKAHLVVSLLGGGLMVGAMWVPDVEETIQSDDMVISCGNVWLSFSPATFA
ncbi:uncharacterized [Tachysurus ichikawai]